MYLLRLQLQFKKNELEMYKMCIFDLNNTFEQHTNGLNRHNVTSNIDPKNEMHYSKEILFQIRILKIQNSPLLE